MKFSVLQISSKKYTCAECKKEFKSMARNAKYCSRECKGQRNKKEYRKKKEK